ncbi:MAG: methyltransferase domain-containing protein [Flavobacteriales bacterium]|nr:methyltransferase domain-containing protein [Flavobacteriales bacterium]
MHVLEIGCGIGTVTGLIAKATSKGSVLGVDISPKSIEHARRNLAKQRHVRLLVSDMSDFQENNRFDLVVLPDVIEHIPVEQHPALFATIAAHLAPNGRVLINVPNAELLVYMHKHEPQTLQVIDQPIHLDRLIRVIYDQGLVLEEMHGYGLRFDLAEYTSLVLRPAFIITTLPEKSKLRRILEELRSRFFL